MRKHFSRKEPEKGMFFSGSLRRYMESQINLNANFVINLVLCRRYGAYIELGSHYANRTFYVFL